MNKHFLSRNARFIFLVLATVAIVLGFVWVEDKPEEKEEISVIVYYAGDNAWDSLQEGVEQAATDFSVNVNFITMREEASAAEQIEIIEREIANGSDGILVAANNSAMLKQALQYKAIHAPLVTVESGIENPDISQVTVDDYAMGQRLGEEILSDYSHKKNLKIVLNSSEKERNSVVQREHGFIDSVGDRAQIIPYGEWDKKDADVIVALHKNSLLHVIEAKDTFPSKVKIYGIGGSAPIVAALDQSKIEKIVFQNEFNMGYLGINVLLEEVRDNKRIDVPVIDYYCVSRDELYGTQYEQLLFTITE